jgi:hypothetical protein
MLRGSTWVRLRRGAGWPLVILSLFPSLSSERPGVQNAKELEFVKAHPNLKPGSFSFTLGWPASPLFRWHKATHFSPSDPDPKLSIQTSSPQSIEHMSWSYSESKQIELVSWSFATLVLGIGVLVYGRTFTKSATRGPTDGGQAKNKPEAAVGSDSV